MRSWIEGGYKLLKRSGWEWQATRMTVPDRVERLWLVLAVATRYVLAVGGEADEAEFADATVPEPTDLGLGQVLDAGDALGGIGAVFAGSRHGETSGRNGPIRNYDPQWRFVHSIRPVTVL